jgi:hypothetical protein
MAAMIEFGGTHDFRRKALLYQDCEDRPRRNHAAKRPYPFHVQLTYQSHSDSVLEPVQLVGRLPPFEVEVYRGPT